MVTLARALRGEPVAPRSSWPAARAGGAGDRPADPAGGPGGRRRSRRGAAAAAALPRPPQPAARAPGAAAAADDDHRIVPADRRDPRRPRPRWHAGELDAAGYRAAMRGRDRAGHRPAGGGRAWTCWCTASSSAPTWSSTSPSSWRASPITRHGWVQSYGSRCVRPPILHGPVRRRGPMTVRLGPLRAVAHQPPGEGDADRAGHHPQVELRPRGPAAGAQLRRDRRWPSATRPSTSSAPASASSRSTSRRCARGCRCAPADRAGLPGLGGGLLPPGRRRRVARHPDPHAHVLRRVRRHPARGDRAGRRRAHHRVRALSALDAAGGLRPRPATPTSSAPASGTSTRPRSPPSTRWSTA